MRLRHNTRSGSVSSVFSNRKRVILLQPQAAEGPPLLTLVMTTIHPEGDVAAAAASTTVAQATAVAGVAAPSKAVRHRSGLAKLPPRSVFLHVAPLQVGADPHAIFQIAKYVTGAIDESIAGLLEGSPPSEAERPEEAPAGENDAPAERSRLLVVVDGAKVQLPGMGVPGGAVAMEAGVKRLVITNVPSAHELCGSGSLTEGAYSGWISSHPAEFPAQGPYTPLPSALALYGHLEPDERPLGSGAGGAVKVAGDAKRPKKLHNDLFLAVRHVYVRTIPQRRSKSKHLASDATPLDVVAPCSFALQVKNAGRQDDVPARRYIVLRVTDLVRVTVANPVLVYAQHMVDTIGCLPTHELASDVAFLNPEKSASDGKANPGTNNTVDEDDNSAADATANLVFVHLDAADVSLIDNAGEELLAAHVQCVQATVEPPLTSQQNALIRLTVDALKVRQTSLEVAAQRVAAGKTGAKGDADAGDAAADTVLSAGPSPALLGRQQRGDSVPQLRLRILLPKVPAHLKAAQYEAFQARRLQLRSILVAEATNASTAKPHELTPEPAPADVAPSLHSLDLALAAIEEDEGGELTPSRVSVSESELSASVDYTGNEEDVLADADVDDDDFAAVDEAQLKAVWLQTELWRGKGSRDRSESVTAGSKLHVRELLEDVDAFLQSSSHRAFTEATLARYISPPPPELTALLAYAAFPEVPPPRIEVAMDGVSLDLDTLPLARLSELFNFADRLPNGDDPHAFPPTSSMVPVDIQLCDVQARIVDGTTLSRLPLYVPGAAQLLMQDASTLIAIQAVHVRIAPNRRIEVMTRGTETGSRRKAAGDGLSRDDDAELATLRQQLAEARAEILQAHQLLAQSHRALQNSHRALEHAEAQREALLGSVVQNNDTASTV
jgi:hypothetical protein